MNDSKMYQTAEEEPCVHCRAGDHGDCTENYCTCDCPAEIAELECCGLPVDEDGYCIHRTHHRRRITPALLDKAVLAASGESDLRAQVRAVLQVVL